MNQVLKLSAAALVLGLAASAAATAQPGGRLHGEGHRAGLALAMLEVADLDGDNTVTRAEIETLEAEEFAFRDRNADGYLDEADASPTLRRMMEIREERSEEAGMDDAPRHRFGRRGQNPEERLEELDADGDGRISQAEFMQRQRPLFERLDADGDEAITPAELDAAVERRMQWREARLWWRD